jgi:hypothetical protein
MNPLLGVALGVAMFVGSALVFRYADALAAARARPARGGVPGRDGGGLALSVALNRGVALGTALLGVATVVLFLK